MISLLLVRAATISALGRFEVLLSGGAHQAVAPQEFEGADFPEQLAGEVLPVAVVEGGSAEGDHRARQRVRRCATWVREASIGREGRCSAIIAALAAVADRGGGHAAEFDRGLESAVPKRAQRGGAIGAAALGEDDDEQAALDGTR